jgi:hypothetical protein
MGIKLGENVNLTDISAAIDDNDVTLRDEDEELDDEFGKGKKK